MTSTIQEDINLDAYLLRSRKLGRNFQKALISRNFILNFKR